MTDPISDRLALLHRRTNPITDRFDLFSINGLKLSYLVLFSILIILIIDHRGIINRLGTGLPNYRPFYPTTDRSTLLPPNLPYYVPIDLHLVDRSTLYPDGLTDR